ncbi:hypothetical protein BDV95DRAFT_569836 [Massariosphaeria phaeospora]|uniref:RAD52 homolog n=1 Tax=Massariosphaeria phaeospora TaxID=100035 RepID=A0A7C8I9A2_9PLEO|nr:hypothetical protein BDV95DRAFT_569836 [Massariosphaeria phaeospora]
MPAPGHQYDSSNIKNPFDERVVNQFTAQEIATLQSRLNKQLGPEYISQRPGNGGGRVAYLEGNKAIALANEVFGFNGWSSSLQQVQVDYVDEQPQSGRVSLGLSIIVRITLKDGTYHEDIGYGSIENGKGKAASFEKAKKEAATDGLKRSLRTFGNVLGNCLYDKEYLKKVQAMKVKPIKFDEGHLYRHPDFAPRLKEEVVKAEGQIVKREPHRTPVRTNQVLRTRTEHLGESLTGEFEDDFEDGNLFDGVDITEHDGDAFTFDTATGSGETAPKALEAVKAADASSGTLSDRPTPGPPGGPRQPVGRMQSAPSTRQQAGAQRPPPQQNQPNQAPGRAPQNPRGPQTPNPQQNVARPETNKARMPPPTVDIHAAPKPNGQPQQSHQQHQPVRPTPLQPQQQSHQQNQQNQPTQAQQQPQAPNLGATTPVTNPPSNHRPPVGFVTSRAAELVQNADPTTSFNHLPSFNPHAESPVPKDKRTPGIDNTRSTKIMRQDVGAPPAPAPPQQPVQTHNQQTPNRQSFNRPNFVNPHQDANRRIGMPGGGAGMHAMSPSANRGAYKPPGFVGGVKRPPLQDVSNQNGVAGPGDGPEAKRQKLEAPGAENAGAGVENA